METTLNIDLNDPRSEKIAEILSNKTCKKILSLIAEKELTETDISQELKIPLNTVDYNIKKLIEAGLIDATSHFWSVKGKKMPTYKVSDKKIIISPKSFTSKSFMIPIVATLLGGAYAAGKYINFKSQQISSDLLFAKSAPAMEGFTMASDLSQPAVQSGFISSLSSIDWILLGIWFGIIGFFFYNKLAERRNISNNVK